jgi:hypothetical protein
VIESLSHNVTKKEAANGGNEIPKWDAIAVRETSEERECGHERHDDVVHG